MLALLTLFLASGAHAEDKQAVVFLPEATKVVDSYAAAQIKVGNPFGVRIQAFPAEIAGLKLALEGTFEGRFIGGTSLLRDVADTYGGGLRL